MAAPTPAGCVLAVLLGLASCAFSRHAAHEERGECAAGDHCGVPVPHPDAASCLLQLRKVESLASSVAPGPTVPPPFNASASSCYVLPNVTSSQNQSKLSRVPFNATCPPECPYSQRLSGDPCFKACVKEEECHYLHPLRVFADASTLHCTVTCGLINRQHIVGCAECQSPGRCKRCMWGHRLVAGGEQCENSLWYMWLAAYIAGGILVLAALSYLVSLWCRPVVSAALLQQAAEHRDRCRPWKIHWPGGGQDAVWERFPVLGTRAHATDVSGLGVMLYFRWLRFLILVGLCVAAAVASAFYVSMDGRLVHVALPSITVSPDNCSMQQNDVLEDVLGQQNASSPGLVFLRIGPVDFGVGHGKLREPSRPAGDPRDFPGRMARTMAVVYVGVTLLSLYFSVLQKRFANRWDEEHSTHKDFVVQASGLPSGATDPEELKQFFQRCLGEAAGRAAKEDGMLRVHGVSIAYDFHEQRELVTESVDQLILELSRARGLQGEGADEEEAGTSPAKSSWVRHLDRLLLNIFASTKQATRDLDGELQRTLQGLRGSGVVFVVVSSELAVDSLVSLPAVQYASSEPLVLKRLESEPVNIFWENIHPHKRSWLEVLIIVGLLITTICTWALLYIPYTIYYVHVTHVPGETASFAEDAILGLLIAIGNLIVSIVVDCIAERLSLSEKDFRDNVVLSLSFCATFLNAICDLGMVLTIAHGIELDNAMEGAQAETGYDRVVARELMSLIVPGYLLLPYVVTPIFEYALPSYLTTMLLRTTRGVALRAAERGLMCPAFDICWRYADILNNFSICIAMLVFATPNACKIMAWFVVFLALIYSIDHYKLLRLTSKTYYTTEALSAAFAYWWSLPTGWLGGIVAWWAVRAGIVRMPGSVAVLLCITLHCALYIAVLRWLRSRVAAPCSRTTKYEETVRELCQDGVVYTYFNTNPVHVLLSHLKERGIGSNKGAGRDWYSIDSVPYEKGKEFLITHVCDFKGLQHSMAPSASGEYLEPLRRLRNSIGSMLSK